MLYEDWDPLELRGLAPRDEYDSYLGGVYRILAGSRSEEALVEFLGRTADATLETARSGDHLRAVAQKLLALDVRL